jgi:hypothetical protein
MISQTIPLILTAMVLGVASTPAPVTSGTSFDYVVGYQTSYAVILTPVQPLVPLLETAPWLARHRCSMSQTITSARSVRTTRGLMLCSRRRETFKRAVNLPTDV